jgi:predicted acylesterase/phospholipase RssA
VHEAAATKDIDMPRITPVRRSTGRLLGVVLVGLLSSACATAPRLPAPATVLNTHAPVGFSPEVRQVGIDGGRTVEAFNQWLGQFPTSEVRAPLQILALSGGGAGSAFGAGALVGMTRAGTRPRFDLVTGISAGALLAPFAFLGPEWDRELAEAFDGGVATGLLQSRGLGSLFSPGLYHGEPLVQLVDRFVTTRLLQAVAAESAKGRRLLVGTTNLDTAESVIWDMGAIAAHEGDDAKRLFRDVLVASSSIPGIFPPVLIRVGSGSESFDEMHVDGGTTTPFFVTPEAGLFRLQPNDLLRQAEVLVLINGQLSVPPASTKVRPVPILSRSFATALTHSSRKSLELAAGLAERLDLGLTISSIPVDYPYRGALDFSHDTMHALFEYGERCARTGRFWISAEAAAERVGQVATGDAAPHPRCPAD